MGAAFSVCSRAAKSAEEAYRSLVADSQYESGHSYSGEIGCSHGFKMKPLGQKKFTKAAKERWVEQAMEETDKWGPWYCLELPRSAAKGYPRGYRIYLFAGWAPE